MGIGTSNIRIWQLSANNCDQPRKLYEHEALRHMDYRSRSYSTENLVIFACKLSNDGQIAIFGYGNGDIELWQVHDFRSLGLLEGHKARVKKIAVSPDGKTIASGGEEGIIKLWDISTYTELLSIEAHDDWIYDLVFSPDGTLLVSSSYDETIKIWGVPGSIR